MKRSTTSNLEGHLQDREIYDNSSIHHLLLIILILFCFEIDVITGENKTISILLEEDDVYYYYRILLYSVSDPLDLFMSLVFNFQEHAPRKDSTLLCVEVSRFNHLLADWCEC